MSISNYYENALLNSLRNVSAAKTAVYVKLHTADPGEDCTTAAFGDTRRVAVTFAAPSGDGSLVSNADVLWSTLTAAGTITHVSLWDDPTAGNALWSGALAAGKTVAINDDFKIASGNLTVTLS